MVFSCYRAGHACCDPDGGGARRLQHAQGRRQHAQRFAMRCDGSHCFGPGLVSLLSSDLVLSRPAVALCRFLLLTGDHAGPSQPPESAPQRRQQSAQRRRQLHTATHDVVRWVSLSLLSLLMWFSHRGFAVAALALTRFHLLSRSHASIPSADANVQAWLAATRAVLTHGGTTATATGRMRSGTSDG